MWRPIVTSELIKQAEAEKKDLNEESGATLASVGDVITTTSRPPAGAIVLGKMGCAKPVSFTKVAYHAANNITIWRPRAEDGDEYVSLGDIAEPGTTAPISTQCVWCHAGL